MANRGPLKDWCPRINQAMLNVKYHVIQNVSLFPGHIFWGMGHIGDQPFQNGGFALTSLSAITHKKAFGQKHTQEMGVGRNPVPPVNVPIPTKIPTKMGGELTYPKMGFHWFSQAQPHMFHQGTAGFSPCVHLPGFHVGYRFFDPQPYGFIHSTL